MTELILIHRPRNGNPLEGDLLKNKTQEIPLWSTCLRQMAMMPSYHFSQIKDQVREGDEVYSAEQAYEFLLHVVCGLKSPLVGETEVQGQFKQFVQDISERYPEVWGLYSAFFQQVLSETKKIRSQFLLNLGSQSYGSLIRRRLKLSEGISILGSGQLAQEILPWLKEVQRVHIHARNMGKAHNLKQGFPHVEVHPWPSPVRTQVLVIAAPVDNSDLVRHLESCSFHRIIDLRGEEQLESHHLQLLGVSGDQYEPLGQLMREIQEDSVRISEKVHGALSAIEQCLNNYQRKMIIRPGGWEDLCG